MYFMGGSCHGLFWEERKTACCYRIFSINPVVSMQMVILVITNSLQNCFFFAKIKEKGPFDGKEII